MSQAAWWPAISLPVPLLLLFPTGRLPSRRWRGVLWTAVLGVALPTIGRQMHASLGTLEWVVSGYTLTLAALLLPGGALGEGAALAMLMVPFLLTAILFSYFGLQRRRWQQGGADK